MTINNVLNFPGVSLYHYLEATDPASNHPECVVRYAQFLKYKYKEMSVLPDPDWPPAMATKDHYVKEREIVIQGMMRLKRVIMLTVKLIK